MRYSICTSCTARGLYPEMFFTDDYATYVKKRGSDPAVTGVNHGYYNAYPEHYAAFLPPAAPVSKRDLYANRQPRSCETK